MVETVSRKRIVTQAEIEKEQKGRTTPDFWEFIEEMTDEMWAGDFMLYIYREDPKPSNYGGSNCLEKCPGFMIMPNGVRLKMDSREDIELAIKEKWGGKAFRLILKKGRERLTEGKCMNDAPPKYPDTAAAQYQQNPLPNAATGTSDNVATRAMDLVANQNPQLINIAIDAVSRAAEIVSKHSQQPTAPPAATTSLDQELEREFKRAMIARMTAAPADPLETYLRIRDVLGAGNNPNGGFGGVKDFLELLNSLKTSGLVSLGAPAVGRTTLLDIGREFIPVLGTVMHEYRLSREADARITEIQRSAMPPHQPAPTVAQPNPPAVLPTPQPAPQAAPPPAAPTLTFQQIENHIAKIVTNMEFPTDEAVDKVLEFLYDTDPRIVGALLNPPSLDPRLKPGKDGLMQLFTFEPELKGCLSNVPRLSEFLDKFIVAATEAEAAEARLRAAAPASTTPA
jgi:hypothetical protein